MRRILDSELRSATVHTEDQGDVQRDEVASVTFEDHVGGLHTLVFHPPGTNVAGEAENEPRIVGEHVPHYSFATPDEAVDAYENGRIV